MTHEEFIDKMFSILFESQNSDEDEEEVEEEQADDNGFIDVEFDTEFTEIVDLVRKSFSIKSRQTAIKLIFISGVNSLSYYSSLIEEVKKLSENNIDEDISIDSSDIDTMDQ